ncbi:MAG: hypothetical protein ACHQF2_02515 [Flavobacteriales bacterium]
MKQFTAAEGVELEDFTEETDSSEEDLEDSKVHCPFWDPFSAKSLFFSSLSVKTEPADEFIVSHILPVESPPPRS